MEKQTQTIDKNVAYDKLKKDNAGRIHISFSELTQFRECGHKHLIEKYLKLAVSPTSIHLIFGNSIHSALEAGIRDKLDLSARIMHFKLLFTKEMMDKMSDTTEIKELDNFITQGENILKQISTEKILEKYDLIGVEMDLYENLYLNFHFKGFIDLILRDKETKRVLIIDYKTSGEIWDVSKKKKDKTFMAQMRLYKYFYARKLDEKIENVDCKYIVLNRLKSKKDPSAGFGSIQPVEIQSTEKDIVDAVTMVAETLRDIHINKNFQKAKLIGNVKNCFFCPYKNNLNLCDSNTEQGKIFLDEHRERRKKIANGEMLEPVYK